jgi:hypothetical protein
MVREEISGRLVALSQGKPTLLEALDAIDNRTQRLLQLTVEDWQGLGPGG